MAGEVQLSSSNSSELILLTLWLNDDDDALIEIKVVGKRIVVVVVSGLWNFSSAPRRRKQASRQAIIQVLPTLRWLWLAPIDRYVVVVVVEE